MSWLSEIKSSKLLRKQTRPLARPGLWVSCLLPVGLTVNVLRHNVTEDYLSTCILSWLILVSQGLILRKLLKPNGGTGRWFLYSQVATGCVTIIAHSFVTGQSVSIGLSAGLLVTLGVHCVFSGLLHYLPKSFTIGEAAVVGQGLSLFLFKSLILDLPGLVTEEEQDDVVAVRSIVEVGILLILLLIGLMRVIGKRVQNFFVFSCLTGLIVLGITCLPITRPIPILFVLEFLFNDPQKILVLVIFSALIAATGGFCYWHTASKRPTSTAIRKAFHSVIVLVFLIGILYQRLLLFLGAGVTLAIFLLLEAIRIGKVDYLSEFLETTVKSFVDNQDSGMVALTPIYLLIGHAAPLFLSPVAMSGGRGQILPLLSGVLSVGVGDSFAGLVGSLYGRHRWSGSKKSIEGTIANAVSQLVVIGLMVQGGFLPSWTTFPGHLICLSGVITNAIVEAKTDQVDNLIVPLVTFVIFSWI